MSHVFLTNATGYIGSAVAEAFKSRGYEVTALARSEQAAFRLKEKGIKAYTGDLKEPKTFLAAVRSADIIIHTAATNDADFGQVDQRAVEEILNALRGTNKTLIYTSGTWILGNTGEVLADESTPLNPLPFVAFRAEVEKEVLAAKEQGIKSIVIRPTIVYGRGGGLIGGFLATAKTDGYARYVGNGENRVSTVHIDDLANLYVLAAEKAKAGSLFHASNDRPIKLREIAELVAATAGFPGKVQSWPQEEARKVVGPFVDGFVLDQQIVSSAAQKLGWQPKSAYVTEEIAAYEKVVAAKK